MVHKKSLETLDRTMRDQRNNKNRCGSSVGN